MSAMLLKLKLANVLAERMLMLDINKDDLAKRMDMHPNAVARLLSVSDMGSALGSLYAAASALGLELTISLTPSAAVPVATQTIAADVAQPYRDENGLRRRAPK